jgi:hypothetical protein
MVMRLSQKLPFVPFPQMCVKPKKFESTGVVYEGVRPFLPGR